MFLVLQIEKVEKEGHTSHKVRYSVCSLCILMLTSTHEHQAIFRTLPHSEPEEYLESCQTSMVQHFLKNLV